jgi:hypothetical protein
MVNSNEQMKFLRKEKLVIGSQSKILMCALNNERNYLGILNPGCWSLRILHSPIHVMIIKISFLHVNV